MPTQIIWRQIRLSDQPTGEYVDGSPVMLARENLVECPECKAVVADALHHADWHAYEASRILRVSGWW